MNHIVYDCSYLPNLDLQASLLPGFAPGSMSKWLPQLNGPTWKGPTAFGGLLVPPDEEDPVALADDDPYGYNRCAGIFASHLFAPSWNAPRMISGGPVFVNDPIRLCLQTD
jgi:hypothetical protein